MLRKGTKYMSYEQNFLLFTTSYLYFKIRVLTSINLFIIILI
jgi:hypothetical protein